jgi:hypothetical protein
MPDVNAIEAAIRQTMSEQAKSEAMRRVMTALGVTAGAGIAARGAMGLGKQFSRAVRGPSRTMPTQQMLQVPVEYEMDPEEQKLANDGAADAGGSVLDSIGKSFGSFIHGDNASRWYGVPWAMPAVAGAGAGGLYGGWKLTDYVMDRRRKQEMKAKLDRARKEYREALLGKSASDGQETEATLLHDELVALHKEANDAYDAMGALAGMYGTAAGGVGLLGMLAAYNWAKKRQRRELVDKAQKRRFADRQMRQPLPLQAVPVAVKGTNIEKKPPLHAAPELSF